MSKFRALRYTDEFALHAKEYLDGFVSPNGLIERCRDLFERAWYDDDIDGDEYNFILLKVCPFCEIYTESRMSKATEKEFSQLLYHISEYFPKCAWESNYDNTRVEAIGMMRGYCRAINVILNNGQGGIFEQYLDARLPTKKGNEKRT